jgi:hypothetical protein
VPGNRGQDGHDGRDGHSLRGLSGPLSIQSILSIVSTRDSLALPSPTAWTTNRTDDTDGQKGDGCWVLGVRVSGQDACRPSLAACSSQQMRQPVGVRRLDDALDCPNAPQPCSVLRSPSEFTMPIPSPWVSKVKEDLHSIGLTGKTIWVLLLLNMGIAS